jgi:hypothetical protein
MVGEEMSCHYFTPRSRLVERNLCDVLLRDGAERVRSGEAGKGCRETSALIVIGMRLLVVSS